MYGGNVQMRTQSKQPTILSNDFPLLDKSIYWAISTNIPTMQGIDIKTNWQCGHDCGLNSI
jgi:hypothetical protein